MLRTVEGPLRRAFYFSRCGDRHLRGRSRKNVQTSPPPSDMRAVAHRRAADGSPLASRLPARSAVQAAECRELRNVHHLLPVSSQPPLRAPPRCDAASVFIAGSESGKMGARRIASASSAGSTGGRPSSPNPQAAASRSRADLDSRSAVHQPASAVVAWQQWQQFAFAPVRTVFASRSDLAQRSRSSAPNRIRPNAASACHAEGRGFESHHPLSERPVKAPFVLSDRAL